MKGKVLFMKKVLKNLAACISAIVVAAAGMSSVSAEEMTVVYDGYPISYTVLDDKGMLLNDDYYQREDYKILYDGKYLYKAITINNQFRFMLSDDVVYEEVNDRVNEIFRDCFPEDISIEGRVPTISSRSYKGWNDSGTVYTVYLSDNSINVLSDESVEQAKKQSGKMMKMLNDEGLISVFYDIGESYELIEYDDPYTFYYKTTDDIDSVTAFLESDQKYCDYHIYVYNDNFVNSGYCKLETSLEYEMYFTDLFDVAADIYEATGVAPTGFSSNDLYQIVYGKNSLNDLSDAIMPDADMVTVLGDVNLDSDVGIADVLLLSKYTTNPYVYPITDLTAYSNADLNWDGQVDSVDTSILIETFLGSFIGL